MTIAEVARQYDLTPDTLRYYERIGLIPAVERTAGGIRNYHDSDCSWIAFIKCMRQAGLPVEVLIRYVELFQQGDATIAQRKALLVEQRTALEKHIVELQETLARLNLKIDRYDRPIVPQENELKQQTGGPR